MDAPSQAADVWCAADDASLPADVLQPTDDAEVEASPSPSEVLRRIEDLVTELIDDAANGRLTELQLLPNRQRRIQDADQPAMQRRTLTGNQAASAYAYVRVFKVLEVIHELLRTGSKATQRDIYYKLQHPELFPSPVEVNAAIQDAVSLLRAPRSCLAITCASRGAIAGSVLVRDDPAAAWQDCRLCSASGRAIPGDLDAVAGMGVRLAARYILVVEKDAVFQRLTADRVFDHVPCVLLTAKGMPDVASRAMLRRLHEADPLLPVLALVDWNPSGVAIMCCYKLGERGARLEAAARYSLPALRWLGLRSDQLMEADDSCFSPLTKRDKAMIPGLLTRLQHEEAWVQEVQQMEAAGVKADIEAAYSVTGVAGFTSLLRGLLLARSWI